MKQKTNSFIPILIMALGSIVLVQLFSPNKETLEKNVPAKIQEQDLEGSQPSRTNTSTSQTKIPESLTTLSRKDFGFVKSSSGTETKIQTNRFIVHLSSMGARIKSFYLRNHEYLSIPDTVIQERNDPTEIQYNALEVTRKNGMDFQPHIYYSGNALGSQLAEPKLNEAAFAIKKRSIYLDNSKSPIIQEIEYDVPVRFVEGRLHLKKIYRFYEDESYFRQITIIQNVRNKEFGLFYQKGTQQNLADLYYKPFSDMGPWSQEGSAQVSTGYIRFFDYNQKVQVRRNSYSTSSASCNPFVGCSKVDQDGLYTRFYDAPDTLGFIGAGSRYFLTYADYLVPEHVYLPKPDGILYKNMDLADGKEAFTVVFRKFLLAPRQSNSNELLNNLSLSKGDLNVSGQDELIRLEEMNNEYIEQLQKDNKDMLVIDQRVYAGTYSTRNHDYNDKTLMSTAFRQNLENAKVLDVVHAGFTGFFYKVSEFIVRIMNALYAVTGNYGWSIILIVLVVKLLTFPINHVQMKSMQKMSTLRPQIEEINKKYTDPRERQKKIIEFYRVNKVNPAKGCLPILIQMPIFISLYSAFANSVELWHSPFMLWMTDLSQPDTVWMVPFINIGLNILPLVMVVTQVLQQHFTMTISDPNQKMLIYLMPCMMLFFFWQLPSGVTLYWTAQNLFSLLERFIPFAYAKMKGKGVNGLFNLIQTNNKGN